MNAIKDAAPVFGTPGYRTVIASLELERKYDDAIAKLTADLEEAMKKPGLPGATVPAGTSRAVSCTALRGGGRRRNQFLRRRKRS